jgi:hypothetical protein
MWGMRVVDLGTSFGGGGSITPGSVEPLQLVQTTHRREPLIICLTGPVAGVGAGRAAR